MWAKRSQKMVRDLKFLVWEEEGMYYLCRENKGADLHLCFRICKSSFSHDAAHMIRYSSFVKKKSHFYIPCKLCWVFTLYVRL